MQCFEVQTACLVYFVAMTRKKKAGFSNEDDEDDKPLCRHIATLLREYRPRACAPARATVRIHTMRPRNRVRNRRPARAVARKTPRIHVTRPYTVTHYRVVGFKQHCGCRFQTILIKNWGAATEVSARRSFLLGMASQFQPFSVEKVEAIDSPC